MVRSIVLLLLLVSGSVAPLRVEAENQNMSIATFLDTCARASISGIAKGMCIGTLAGVQDAAQTCLQLTDAPSVERFFVSLRKHQRDSRAYSVLYSELKNFPCGVAAGWPVVAHQIGAHCGSEAEMPLGFCWGYVWAVQISVNCYEHYPKLVEEVRQTAQKLPDRMAYEITRKAVAKFCKGKK